MFPRGGIELSEHLVDNQALSAIAIFQDTSSCTIFILYGSFAGIRYALLCFVVQSPSQRTPYELLKNREIKITALSENPRVYAERGLVRFRPWHHSPCLKMSRNVKN